MHVVVLVLSKQTMKRLSYLLLACFLALSLHAQKSADDARIVIKQKSGNETMLDLSMNPTITFEGEEMVVSTPFTRIYIPLDDIEEYVVSETATGIKAVTPSPKMAAGKLTFTSLPKGTPVCVYSIGGSVVSRTYSDQTGLAEVDIDGLPKGTYIVSVMNKSIKVTNIGGK